LDFANRESAGLYSSRNPTEPRVSKFRHNALKDRKSLPRQLRPRQEWVETTEDALADFLEPDVKRAMLAHLDEILRRLERTLRPGPKRDRHAESEFLLTNILTCRQGGYRMTGRTTGRRGKRVRYYLVSRGRSVPVRGSVLKRLIPAEPVENAVLGAIEKFFQDSDLLRPQIEAVVREQFYRRQRERQGVDELRREREKLAAKLEFVLDQLDEIGRDTATAEIAQFQDRLRELDQRIRAASVEIEPAKNVEAETEAVLKRLRSLRQGMATLPRRALRDLLAALIATLEIDLVIRQLLVEFRLPAAEAGSPAQNADVPQVRPCMQGSRSGTPSFDAAIAVFVCNQPTRQECWTCQRRAA
jgi:hypothetical protein